MKWSWVLLLALLSCGSLTLGKSIMEFPELDGEDRVHDLTAKNFKSVMKKYDMMVVYYHEHPEDRVAQKQLDIEELALEVGQGNTGMTGRMGRRKCNIGILLGFVKLIVMSF